MFQAFYSDSSYARGFRTLKEAKWVGSRAGYIKIVSLKTGKVYWLGVDY